MAGTSSKQWTLSFKEKFKLSRAIAHGREVGGTMLNITGLNNFYYIRNFTDMRCKYDRVLSIIREQLHREPERGDVFIVMSRNRRLIRMFMYDRSSCSLFEKKFRTGYQFMKIVKENGGDVYRIDWKDVVLLLENPVINSLKIR